jgi:hypothetical protein
LKKAYRYLDRPRPEGEEPTKDEHARMKDIVSAIAKTGLSVRTKGREQVSLECARVLGEIGDESAAKYLKKWLEQVCDEKSPHPSWVEFGFQSLAWIGPDDSGTQDLILKYASTGRHPDMTVASHALRACYLYRELDGKTRKEFFNKVLGYVNGLYSGWQSGDPKAKATYEQRYNAVKDNGLKALEELAGDGQKFDTPVKAMDWWNENKKSKWETYYGPRERERRAKLEGDKPAEEPGEEKPAEEPKPEDGPGDGGEDKPAE